MKPELVTFTGADDNTSITEMELMARNHPNVEFGILISEKNQGSSRYPSYNWLRELVKSRVPKIALHLQGRQLRNLLAGGDVFVKTFWDVIEKAQRIQLNFHGDDGIIFYDEMFKERIDKDLANFQFIFQCDGNNGQAILDLARKSNSSDRFCPLFDTSGGAGILPENWPVNEKYPYAGYAGGLGAHNVSKILPAIQKAAGSNRYWIDMETWVCDPKNGLIFEKMYEVLDQVEKC